MLVKDTPRSTDTFLSTGNGNTALDVKYHSIAKNWIMKGQPLVVNTNTLTDIKFETIQLVLASGLMEPDKFFSAEDTMDWDGDQPTSRYTPIHYDDNSILVLRESAVCTVIAKDLTDSNDTPIVVLLSLALKQESTAKKSNATLEVFDFRAVEESHFTSLPTPSDNDLIQPWEFTVNYGLHLIKNSDNYLQDENGKTWVACV